MKIDPDLMNHIADHNSNEHDTKKLGYVQEQNCRSKPTHISVFLLVKGLFFPKDVICCL